MQQKHRLTYDVFTAKGTQQRELPFVLGILANFGGQKPPDPHRRFVTVDRDNIETVLRSLSPELRIKVQNTLANDDTKLGCELHFNSLDDFSPEGVARQIPALQRLLELRASLASLRARIDKNPKLQQLLHDFVADPGKLKQAKDQEGL